MIWIWLLASMAQAIQTESLPTSVSLETGPKAANNKVWISAADYPLDLATSGNVGAVRILYSIDDTGVVFRCDVDKSSGVRRLDEAACDAMKRNARFIPAKDSNGQKIPSRLSRVISFFSDEQSLALPPDFSSDRAYNVLSSPGNKTYISTGIRQIFDANGKVESCSIEISSGIKSVDEKACELGSDIAEDGPMRDHHGNPVRSMRLSTITLIAPPHS